VYNDTTIGGEIVQYIIISLQVVLLCGISLLGNCIAQFLHLSIPGNILGMVVLFFLMERKILSLTWIESGANFLIAELLLFFIPSAIGVIQFQRLLISQFVNLSIVIVCSTLAVVLFVGLLTETILRYNQRRQHDSLR
jgi:holin-like protein